MPQPSCATLISQKCTGFCVQPKRDGYCRETLMMAAHTRMPGHISAPQKSAFVEDLIKRLGLTKAADSVVGDKKKRGLSGGEKKRLSIGAELIAQPTLLFTDEPTTGLDSFQAEKVSNFLQCGLALATLVEDCWLRLQHFLT